MATIKVNDRVNIMDNGVAVAQGTVYNINEWREPSMKYAVDVDGYYDDVLFMGDDRLQKVKE